jgi:hypothetical protein
MIWAIKDVRGKIYFHTPDNMKFIKLIDAVQHVTSNYVNLKEQQDCFNARFERNRKLKLIMAKM